MKLCNKCEKRHQLPNQIQPPSKQTVTSFFPIQLFTFGTFYDHLKLLFIDFISIFLPPTSFCCLSFSPDIQAPFLALLFNLFSIFSFMHHVGELVCFIFCGVVFCLLGGCFFIYVTTCIDLKMPCHPKHFKEPYFLFYLLYYLVSCHNWHVLQTSFLFKS